MAAMLAVYIHWPFCRAKCPYCDFNSHVREEVDEQAWRSALLAEMEHRARLAPGARLGSIFFGGGTPSLMPAATVQALIERAVALWPAVPDIEITLEANPTSVESCTFPDFRRAGVNRVSLGVQSLFDESLRFLGRGHSAREARDAIDLAAGVFDRYSFDLIYARPGQSEAAWEAELSEAIALANGHLSLYQLTLEENTAFHHAHAQGRLFPPEEAQAEALYRLTETRMQEAGMPAYEVSNYAAPGQESRHNLAYWRGHDYVGIGPGAHGRIAGAEETRLATQTYRSPERWLEAVRRNGHGIEIEQRVDAKEAAAERLLMGLRLTEGMEALPLLPYLNARKRTLFMREGLLADDEKHLRATLKGRLTLNRLTEELLA